MTRMLLVGALSALVFAGVAVYGDAGSGGLTLAQASPTVTTTASFFRNRHIAYGGFEQTILWQLNGGEATSFDVEYSLDGGESFVTIENGVSGDRRQLYWIVPEGVRSNRGVIRVTAHFEDGSTASDDWDDRIQFRPSSGPRIKAIDFDPGRDEGNFVVKGRFDADISVMQVDGAMVGASSISSQDVVGNTTKKIFGTTNLDETFPVGVEVTVRVVNPRTGVATDEFRVTRR